MEGSTADRLTGVADTIDGVCAARGYGFDVNGNRLSKTTKAYAASCSGTPTSTVSKAWTYDGADRVQTGANGSGSYVYDGLGRQTNIPGADTPKGSSAGNLSATYFDTDLVRSVTQNGVTTTFGLDVVGRRSVQTTTGTTPTTVTRHYTDTSDNPGWATSTTGSTTKTTRYTGSIGGDLSATVTDGVVTVDVADLQGTVATSVTVDASGVGTVGALGVYDEYGNTITAGPATGAVSYGWLGGKERATEDTTGLVLMGVRLYNSVTGLFTSVDPVEGGNTTAYVYPQDPINTYDISGLSYGYNYYFKITTRGNLPAATIMKYVKAHLSSVFPISVGGCKTIYLGRRCILGLGVGPVSVTGSWTTGWQFTSGAHHIEGSGLKINFNLIKIAGKKGSYYLHVDASGPGRWWNARGPLAPANRAFAWDLWNTLAGNIERIAWDRLYIF